MAQQAAVSLPLLLIALSHAQPALSSTANPFHLSATTLSSSLIITTTPYARPYQSTRPPGEKYIGVSLDLGCPGIGNVMWRFATARALGVRLNRTVYYDSGHELIECIHHAKYETFRYFPNFSQQLYLPEPAPDPDEVWQEWLSDNCCDYADTSKLKEAEGKWLEITGYNYLQNYRYFNGEGKGAEKRAVLESFQCGTWAKKRAAAKKALILG